MLAKFSVCITKLTSPCYLEVLISNAANSIFYDRNHKEY